MAIPFITITLDRPRRLRFGMSAMCEFEQTTSLKLRDIDSDLSMDITAKLLWAMLRQDEPDLTLEAVCETCRRERILHDGHRESRQRCRDRRILGRVRIPKRASPGPKAGEEVATAPLNFSREFAIGVGELNLLPEQFWSLTYAEFMEMSRGFRRRQKHRANELLYLAWHIELFQRLERLPKLEDLLKDEEPEPVTRTPQSDDDMLAMARVLNAVFGGEVVES